MDPEAQTDDANLVLEDNSRRKEKKRSRSKMGQMRKQLTRMATKRVLLRPGSSGNLSMDDSNSKRAQAFQKAIRKSKHKGKAEALLHPAAQLKREATKVVKHYNRNRHKLKAPIFFVLWLAWLLLGTLFFAYAPDIELGGAKGFYMALNIGYSIGFGYPSEESNNYLYFSSLYVMIGASFVGAALGFFADRISKDGDSWFTKMEQQKDAEQAMLDKRSRIRGKIQVFWLRYSSALKPLSVWGLFVITLIVYSMKLIGWPFREAQYFAITALSTGGHWSIPNDSPDWMFAVTGALIMVGVPIMALAMAQTALVFVGGADLDEAKATIDAVITKEELLLLEKLGLEDADGEIDQAEFILLCMIRMGTDLGLIKYIMQRFSELNFYTGEALTISQVTQGACDFVDGQVRRRESVRNLDCGRSKLVTVGEDEAIIVTGEDEVEDDDDSTDSNPMGHVRLSNFSDVSSFTNPGGYRLSNLSMGSDSGFSSLGRSSRCSVCSSCGNSTKVRVSFLDELAALDELSEEDEFAEGSGEDEDEDVEDGDGNIDEAIEAYGSGDLEQCASDPYIDNSEANLNNSESSFDKEPSISKSSISRSSVSDTSFLATLRKKLGGSSSRPTSKSKRCSEATEPCSVSENSNEFDQISFTNEIEDALTRPEKRSSVGRFKRFVHDLQQECKSSDPTKSEQVQVQNPEGDPALCDDIVSSMGDIMSTSTSSSAYLHENPALEENPVLPSSVLFQSTSTSTILQEQPAAHHEGPTQAVFQICDQFQSTSTSSIHQEPATGHYGSSTQPASLINVKSPSQSSHTRGSYHTCDTSYISHHTGESEEREQRLSFRQYLSNHSFERDNQPSYMAHREEIV